MAKTVSNNAVHKPVLSKSEIYEGGLLRKITAKDLLNNEVAIISLMNDFNLKENELSEKEETIRELKSDVEHLRTTPFMAIISTIINILGTLVTGIGVEQRKEPDGIWLICVGALLVLIGSIASVLFPYAKRWFNKRN